MNFLSLLLFSWLLLILLKYEDSDSFLVVNGGMWVFIESVVLLMILQGSLRFENGWFKTVSEKSGYHN